jgi:hypothetical protein
MAYAAAKKRYLAEFRTAMPILIAIGLKRRPETAEIEEFRSAFRVLDGEEEQWVAKATAEMLKRFDNDQAVAAAEKEFVQAQELKRLLLRILMDSIRPDIGFPEQPHLNIAPETAKSPACRNNVEGLACKRFWTG